MIGTEISPESTELTAVTVTLYSVYICSIGTTRVYCITAGYISVGTLYMRNVMSPILLTDML